MTKAKHPVRVAVEARKRGDVDFLLALLADTDRASRLTAAFNLGEMGSQRAVTPLTRCLRSGDETLQIVALKALAKIGDNSVVSEVADVATGEAQSEYARPLCRLLLLFATAARLT